MPEQYNAVFWSKASSKYSIRVSAQACLEGLITCCENRENCSCACRATNLHRTSRIQLLRPFCSWACCPDSFSQPPVANVPSHPFVLLFQRSAWKYAQPSYFLASLVSKSLNFCFSCSYLVFLACRVLLPLKFLTPEGCADFSMAQENSNSRACKTAMVWLLQGSRSEQRTSCTTFF